jgi:hypothetical protein
MSRLIAGFALIASFVVAPTASAQLVPGASWSLPEVTVNAPGLEHAYLVIVPYQGSAQAQQAIISTARDGQTAVDAPQTVTLPIESTLLGRRTSIHLNDWAQFSGGQLQIANVKVSCPTLCTVQLILRPQDAATFWARALVVNAIPEIVPPDVK